jgi:hypothetical protein
MCSCKWLIISELKRVKIVVTLIYNKNQEFGIALREREESPNEPLPSLFSLGLEKR